LLIQTEADSAFIFIMGHGRNCEIELVGGIQHDDEDVGWIPNTANFYLDIVSQFSEENFPQFRGIPKVIFDVSCQVFNPSDVMERLPKGELYTDILIAHAALPGQNANRFPKAGTIFVRVLLEVLMRFSAKLTLQKMMDIVRFNFPSYMIIRPINAFLIAVQHLECHVFI
jgi:hypothetical protein